MLQIIVAIFITFVFIKIAHKFDNLASDIEVIPLVFIPGLIAIFLSFFLPDHLFFLILPIVFLVALFRLRQYDLLPWGRAFIYSFIVILGFLASDILFWFIFFK